MGKRILTALGILIVVFGFVLGLRQVHPAFVGGMLILLSAFAAYEMCTALKKAEYNTMTALCMICAVCCGVATYFFAYIGLVLSVVAFAFIALAVLTFNHKYELKDVFATIFVFFYPIMPLSLFVHMNNMTVGLYAILLTMFVPVLTDTFAYFFGVAIKGKKLCPTISPKKTIAGAVGGLVGGIAATMLIFVLFDKFDVFSAFKNTVAVSINATEWKTIVIYIALGIIAAPICEIGDLFASWIKRKANIKDYGNIFPGHGGIMDRLDSIVVMVPITCLFIEMLII